MNRSSFALRRGAILSFTLGLSVLLAACGGDDTTGSAGASDNTGGGGTVAVADGNVDLSANNLEFDASVIEAPAGEEFTITFTNLESQPHNVAVDTEEGGDEIVTGEVITGPDATTTITVPALEPGEYYFVCDVHPEMNGTIVVEG
ncbi:MAG TPA: cupredoxin domain-containing protein [Candidatus Limnocylindria bacterium]